MKEEGIYCAWRWSFLFNQRKLNRRERMTMKDSVLDQRSATIQRLSNLLAAIGTSFVFALTITSSPVAFAASGGVPSDTRTEGEWSAPFDLGMIAISAALLPTGKVLFWQYMVGSSGGSRAELGDA